MKVLQEILCDVVFLLIIVGIVVGTILFPRLASLWG